MYKNIEQKYNEKKDELLKFTQRRVVNSCLYLAEDCVNEAFTRLCEHVTRGGEIEEEDFDSLVYRVLFHCIYDLNECEHMRGMTGRKKVRNSYREVNVINKDISDLYNIENVDENLLKTIALKLEVERWEDFRETLRRVLQLYYRDGYNHRQIAWFCDVSEKTSRNIVSMYIKEIVDA